MFMDARSTVTAKEGDRYPLRPPSFVKVSARESHAGQHSSKVLVSRRQTGSTPGGSEDPCRLVATLDQYSK